MGGIVNKVTKIATLGLVDDVTGADAAADAARQAAGIQSQQALGAQAEQARQFDISQGNLAPAREAGDLAREQQLALLGLRGDEAFNQATQQTPAQRFLEKRAQKNLLQNASAIGGLGGGNVQRALVEQGAGFAGAQLQNQFGQLGQVAGQGQTAATNIAQLGAQSQAQQAQLGQRAAEARASGILGQSQADAQATGQLLALGGAAAGAFF